VCQHSGSRAVEPTLSHPSEPLEAMALLSARRRKGCPCMACSRRPLIGVQRPRATHADKVKGVAVFDPLRKLVLHRGVAQRLSTMNRAFGKPAIAADSCNSRRRRRLS
jgi:hypothetical protein